MPYSTYDAFKNAGTGKTAEILKVYMFLAKRIQSKHTWGHANQSNIDCTKYFFKAVHFIHHYSSTLPWAAKKTKCI